MALKSNLMRIVLFIISIVIIQNTWAQKISIVHPAINDYSNVRDFCKSPDGKEIYFTLQSPQQEISQIILIKNNKWKKPILMPFCDHYSYLEPFLSKDGLRLYFASDRPKYEVENEKSDFDIWYVERENIKSKWSSPINLGPPVNTDLDEFYPTLSDNGNLYLTKVDPKGKGKDDIYVSIWDDSNFSTPHILNDNINTEGYEFNAFIANDERFIIFTKYNSPDGQGSGDLYISRKDDNGHWSPAINLGNDVNSRYMEYCPFYDEKTQTLYFTSRRSSLQPQKINDFKALKNLIEGSENGNSKIYQVKLKLW